VVAAKKAMVLNGPVDLADGHQQAKTTCLLCHKLYDEGADVGPDLTGVGRSTLDALLANVIDPTQVIGKGYEQVTITTKEGQTLTGRVVEETPDRVTLLGLNLRETVPRSRISSMDVSEVSLMPEGLDQLPDAAFRNLIWYIYAPPQEQNTRIRVALRDKKLVVSARLPKGRGWAEILEYVMDPALRPYIHPLRDPSGSVVLTDDRPGDHVWQHGVFTGLHKVGGIDFWTERQGKQRFVKLLDFAQEPDRVFWRSLSEWVAPDGEVVLEEEQAVTVHAPATSDGYALDFDWTLRARQKPVTFGHHDYGGLSVRMPLHPQHTHLNANGAKSKDTATKRAAWCTVERPFGDVVWGVAVMDHPRNDRHPAAWRVDDHGMINPSPSLQGDWFLAGGKQMVFRYRVLVYRGPADAVRLSSEFGRFAASPPRTQAPSSSR
jgi:putative heme-binding domain-containing protein